MRLLLNSLLITAITLFSSMPTIAAQDIEKNITALEHKVSKKFSRTFCNTSGFGISDEGSLKFALGETKGEFSKKPLIEQIDMDDLKDLILDDIANTCSYFELAKSDLDELKLK